MKKPPPRVLAFYSGKVVDLSNLAVEPKRRFTFAAMRVTDNASEGYVVEGDRVYSVSRAYRSARILTGDAAATVLAQVNALAPPAVANPLARGGARRSDVIPYEDLIDVADVAQHWYDGQRDPVYALVSSTFAGRGTPLGIAEDALYNLNKDYRRSNDADLGEAVGQLEWAILETRSRAARMPNPLSMGTGEKVAIGVGIVGGVLALAYYGAQALGIGIAKAVGSATPQS